MELSSIVALHPQFDPDVGLLTLFLDHGKANEIGTVELDALAELCDLVEHSPEIVCVCTTSRRYSARGTPIFIAGANVRERAGWSDPQIKTHVVRQRALMQRLRQLPVFTLALSHGVTLGWGTEFLLTADYCLATPTARFALPETGLGILPGARGTADLALHVGPAQALRLGCTGEEIDAATAVSLGLVQECVPDLDAGLLRAQQLAKLLRTRSPTAVATYKRALLASLGQPEAQRLEIEEAAYDHCVDSGDAATGRASFGRRGEVPPWGPRQPG